MAKRSRPNNTNRPPEELAEVETLFTKLVRSCNGGAPLKAMIFKSSAGYMFAMCYDFNTQEGNCYSITPQKSDEFEEFMSDDFTHCFGRKVNIQNQDGTIKTYDAHYVRDFERSQALYGDLGPTNWGDLSTATLENPTNDSFSPFTLLSTRTNIPKNYFDDLLPPGISEDALMDSMGTATSTGDIFDMGFIFYLKNS